MSATGRPMSTSRTLKSSPNCGVNRTIRSSRSRNNIATPVDSSKCLRSPDNCPSSPTLRRFSTSSVVSSSLAACTSSLDHSSCSGGTSAPGWSFAAGRSCPRDRRDRCVCASRRCAGAAECDRYPRAATRPHAPVRRRARSLARRRSSITTSAKSPALSGAGGTTRSATRRRAGFGFDAEDREVQTAASTPSVARAAAGACSAKAPASRWYTSRVGRLPANSTKRPAEAEKWATVSSRPTSRLGGV